jgi:hypothetical protein
MATPSLHFKCVTSYSDVKLAVVRRVGRETQAEGVVVSNDIANQWGAVDAKAMAALNEALSLHLGLVELP